MKLPPSPKGTGPAGRDLWRAVLAAYELAEHELTLLRQAVRSTDICADLQAVVDSEGPMAMTRLGTRVHPALVELRQQRLALARLIVALRVPLGEQEDQTPTPAVSATVARLQRRGLRGVYGGGAS